MGNKQAQVFLLHGNRFQKMDHCRYYHHLDYH